MKRSGPSVKSRLAVSVLFFAVIFLAAGVRAFQLQVLKGGEFKKLGERQHLQQWVASPRRGGIVDRGGDPLALSLEGQSIYVRPRQIEDPAEISRPLARILQLDPSEVGEKLRRSQPFVWLKRQVTPREAEAIRTSGWAGVGVLTEPSRYYPQGRLAGQVLGFVNRDSDGLEGLELRYDRHLRGVSGFSVVERDALGRKVLAEGVEDFRVPPGADVQLTLESSIQHLAEKELQAVVEKYRAKAAIAVAVEPFTGEVLALAGYPFFNPNTYNRAAADQWRNRAVTDSFEPGSTFKTILAAAALEENVVGTEDPVFCEFGNYAYGGRVIHDTHPYGWIPFYRVIQHSSNIGVTKVAEKLQKEKYFKYIERFGFGQPTGIDLPGEAPGLVRRPSSWSTIDLATHAFGQGIAASPIQMAMAYAAVANGGFLMRPFVVRRVVDANGKAVSENQPHVIRRVISERTSRQLRSILTGVVGEGGTGILAEVEGFKVAGKTGTAQKPDLVRGGYSKKRVASFIGFVPAEDPRLVLLVLVDEPEVNVYGGIVAAPIFANIARGALRQLDVIPDKPQEIIPAEPKTLAGSRPSEPPDEASETVTREQVGEAEAPNFIGLSLREAVNKARSLNVQVELRGHGYVVKQTPLPGGREGVPQGWTLVLEG
jgi:cell division protein FtsI (penicillin-binding protein 3)